MGLFLNLLRTEKYDDGKTRYIGMYNTVTDGKLIGGCELIYSKADKLFDELRKLAGVNVKIIVGSEELPSEFKNIGWFKGRNPIGQSELVEIIESQKQGGYNVEKFVA